MLSAEKNRLLTQVGPGTPMGELLRRYWMPIGGASELDSQSDQAHSSDGRRPRALQGSGRTVRAARPPLPAPARGPGLRLRRADRHPLQLSRLAHGRDRPLHRAALRRHRQPALARQGALRHQGLSGEGVRRPAVGLYGPAARARAPGLGAVHLGERLSRSRALRRPLQLVSVPGELLRSGALRMDARQLEPAAQRQDRSLCQQAPQAQVRGVRLRLHLQARARGFRRAQSVLDRGPRRAVAERLLSRQPFRMARAGRRREHAQRRVVLHARAEGARALRPGHGSDLGEPDQGRARPLDLEPRHQPGHQRLGRAGRASPTAPRRISAPATSASR